MSKFTTFQKKMKLRGTVYLPLKIYFLFLVFLAMIPYSNSRQKNKLCNHIERQVVMNTRS